MCVCVCGGGGGGGIGTNLSTIHIHTAPHTHAHTHTHRHTHTHYTILTRSSVVFILSKVSDLILEYCTLSSLCLPEQLMHIRIPRFTLSHSGSGWPQSAHLSLPGRLRIFSMIFYRGNGVNNRSTNMGVNNSGRGLLLEALTYLH